jgi:hypothetical protein
MGIKTKNFKVHVTNPKTDLLKLDADLNRIVGCENYRRFRNYNRPAGECVAEVTFYGEPNKTHFLFSLVHPYVKFDEEFEEWFEVKEETFNSLFEEAA